MTRIALPIVSALTSSSATPPILAVALGLALLVPAAGCGDKSKNGSADKNAKPVAAADAASNKAPAPPRPTLVAAGSKVPSFSGTAHNGLAISNKTLLGKPAVIYFYPKDFTPG